MEQRWDLSCPSIESHPHDDNGDHSSRSLNTTDTQPRHLSPLFLGDLLFTAAAFTTAASRSIIVIYSPRRLAGVAPQPHAYRVRSSAYVALLPHHDPRRLLTLNWFWSGRHKQLWIRRTHAVSRRPIEDLPRSCFRHGNTFDFGTEILYILVQIGTYSLRQIITLCSSSILSALLGVS